MYRGIGIKWNVQEIDQQPANDVSLSPNKL